MSATIKYKGNTIASITTDSSKTLKTSGKYCEGDIVVENVQDGGGGSELVLSDIQLPAITFCTDVIENHIVSSDWSPSCIVEDTTPPPAPKYSYNGVVLPEIPADVLAEYPYCWIRNNTTSGYYDLLLSGVPFYYLPSDEAVKEGNLAVGKPWYRVPIATAETATAWENNTSNNTFSGWGVDSARTVLWSNHDIPNGSATATEIYFEGSEPVLVEASEN